MFLGWFAMTSILATPPSDADWLVDPSPFRAEVILNEERALLRNGLVSREWRLRPWTGCFDLRREAAQFVRAVRPEARFVVAGKEIEVGGASGAKDQAYLDASWLDSLAPKEGAMTLAEARSYSLEDEPDPERPSWRPRYGAPSVDWPPKGKGLALRFAAAGLPDVEIVYELFDGLPTFSKRVRFLNRTSQAVTIDRLWSEELAVTPDQRARFYAEPEYAFNNAFPVRWSFDESLESAPHRALQDWAFGPALVDLPDAALDDPWKSPERAQLQGQIDQRSLLRVGYPEGPAVRLAPGEEFASFRTYETLHDSDDRERRGLTRRRFFQRLAPWTQENPIFMHVRSSDSASIRAAVDQCAEVGFEMLILTFWSGFDMNDVRPETIARYKADFDYAHSKGVRIGGYVLFSSTADYGPANNAQQTDYPPSLCLGSAYSDEYFARLLKFIDETGMDVIETDGPYHGYFCDSTEHKYHSGRADSRRVAWERQRWFFMRCRERGLYVNAPDWYFLAGSNKTGMGYREENWSLPRELQIVLGRQHLYDGTWEKTQSMGWMMLPLVEYHGGGAAATLEPLRDHLDAYEAHLAQNFGAGAMCCYRGPRLFDSEPTREVVSKWTSFYRNHREILQGDLIHIRRPDGRDVDGWVHVRATGRTRGLAMLFNPTSQAIAREFEIPLRYAGLGGSARVSVEGGPSKRVALDAQGIAKVRLEVPAFGRTWAEFAK